MFQLIDAVQIMLVKKTQEIERKCKHIRKSDISAKKSDKERKYRRERERDRKR